MLQNYTKNLYYYFMDGVTLTLKKEGGIFYNLIAMAGYKHDEIIQVSERVKII